MYKLLLCWRYLRTRYLAMVCIVSVMLGVATLIVVNSVMGGFSTKLRERLHGLLSDVVLEAYDPVHGFAAPEAKMAVIRADSFLSERVEAMAPTLEIFAMIQFTYGQSDIARPVKLIGIDAESRSRVGGFAEFLVLNKGRPRFELSPEAKKYNEARNRFKPGLQLQPPMQFESVDGKPPPEPPPSRPFVPECAVVGYAISHFRDEKPDESGNFDRCLLRPGDDIHLTTISGYALKPVHARFAVCDYFKSEMSEYDSNYVFVPLEYLQQLRTMEGRVTSIQIRLKDGLGYAEKKAVVERLKALFQGTVQVLTWEDKQGPLLAAISIEKGILNILLFLIIAVAGFGILAIFSMIVVEKTRDIGIMKALGASNGGVLKIFLGYGLLLGVVGAALGTCLGVSITVYINDIEQFLASATGQEIFPRKVYYFDKIPTDIRALHVALINAGAIAIAVLFSVLPALRAAMLHPVRALRYE
ncbi:MAG: FtsX-like permease family protein [Gemmataceae bacterium]